MNLLNQHTLTGHIQTDTALQTGRSGKQYINLLLGVEDHYKKEGEFIKNYQAIPMIAFGKVAENVAERTVKGQKVLFQFKIVSQPATQNDNPWIVPLLIIQNFETMESKDRATDRLEKRKKERKTEDETPEKVLEKDIDVINEIDDVPEALNPLNNYHIGYQMREVDYL